MQSFDQFLTVLSEIPDPRRAEGKLYKLPYVLLFSILTVVTGGNSFRSIETFIKVHRRRLNAAFGLHWKRAPAHTAIRYILQGLDPQAVEQVFCRHAVGLRDTAADPAQRTIALDGKTLRRSFDNFNYRKAAQLLHAFDTEAGLVLAHIDIVEKSNEIPAAQQLLGELQVAHCIVTLDAMHCQKKPSRPPRYSAPPAPLPVPSGNPSSRPSFVSPAMSCTEMPRQVYGAAPPRSHTTWPIPPHRRASPPPRFDVTGMSRVCRRGTRKGVQHELTPCGQAA